MTPPGSLAVSCFIEKKNTVPKHFMFVARGLLYTALTRNASQTRSHLVSLTDGRGKDKLQVLHLHMPILTDAVPTRI